MPIQEAASKSPKIERHEALSGEGDGETEALWLAAEADAGGMKRVAEEFDA